MPHPDRILPALRTLDELCWETAEETGDGWINITAYADRIGTSEVWASRLLARLWERGYADRKWVYDDPQGDRRFRRRFYGVSEAGADRLLAEDGMPVVMPVPTMTVNYNGWLS